MSSSAEHLRGKYWQLRNKLQSPGGVTPTVDREIALLQAEILTEVAIQQAETNELLKKITLLNFEKIGMQLSLFLDEHAETR